MNIDRPVHDTVSERIIGCAFTVCNTLGSGFLKKIQEMRWHSIRAAGAAIGQQWPVAVIDEGSLVGEHFVALQAEGAIIIELKTVRAFDGAQCNDLRATGRQFCLLTDFGRLSRFKAFEDSVTYAHPLHAAPHDRCSSLPIAVHLC